MGRGSRVRSSLEQGEPFLVSSVQSPIFPSSGDSPADAANRTPDTSSDIPARDPRLHPEQPSADGLPLDALRQTAPQTSPKVAPSVLSAGEATSAELQSSNRGIYWGLVTVLSILCIASIYLAWDFLWGGGSSRKLGFQNQVTMRLVDIFVVGWTVWMGTAVGSFLNVVAYRLPLGRRLDGRSHCPQCDNQLSWRENTPVLGWIFLGGRCGHCDCSIPSRYPIVEAVVGLSLGCIALSRLYNYPLPHQSPPLFRGQFGGPTLTDWQTWITLGFHITSLSTLWAMALIRFDGGKLPVKMVWFIAVSVLAIIAMPWLNIESWKQIAESNSQPMASPSFISPSFISPSILSHGRLDAAVACICAIVTATLIGRSLARGLNPTADLKLDPLGRGTRRMVDLIAMVALVSLVVGWQSTIAVVVVASVLAVLMLVVTKFPADPLARMSVAIPVACTFQIVAWNWLHEQTYWPSDMSRPIVILIWAAAALCTPIWLRGKAIDVVMAKNTSTKSFGGADAKTNNFNKIDEGDEDGI